jgi:uncharacterized phage-associated protein
MNLNIQTIADYFLVTAREEGDYISQLKLQKLVYYAQAWFLALYGEQLFEDDCEAWVHGPAYQVLYDRFRIYGWKPILEPESDEVTRATVDLPVKVKEHLDEIISVFGSESAHNLELMTHREMPWLKARNGIPETDASRAVIQKTDMQVFYKAFYEQTHKRTLGDD